MSAIFGYKTAVLMTVRGVTKRVEKIGGELHVVILEQEKPNIFNFPTWGVNEICNLHINL